MTPEEYIEQLKKTRRKLGSIKNDIDSAIYNMERRLETGYEVCENSSKLDVSNAFENATDVQKALASLSVTEIIY